MTEQPEQQQQEQGKGLRAVLHGDVLQQQLALALPEHLSAERFIRIAGTALTKTPKLMNCTEESFIKCLLDLSAAGLEPDGRRAYLIPYKTTCSLIIGYQGLVELVRRSGNVSTIHADIVCANDTFEHDRGQILQHTFDARNPRGEVYAVYAELTMADGSRQSEIMQREDVENIRKRSKSANDGPWATDWNEMAKKTVFRRACKWVTLSSEIQTAIAYGDVSEFPRTRVVHQARRIPLDPFSQTDGSAAE